MRIVERCRVSRHGWPFFVRPRIRTGTPVSEPVYPRGFTRPARIVRTDALAKGCGRRPATQSSPQDGPSPDTSIRTLFLSIRQNGETDCAPNSNFFPAERGDGQYRTRITK